MTDVFRGPLVCRLTGISYRQLDYWARNDVVRPSIAEARGSGSQRRYSYEDVVLVAVVANLSGAGVSLVSARLGVEALRRSGSEDDVALVIDGAGVTLARTAEDLAAALEYGSRVMTVVNLPAVRTALDEAIAGSGHGSGEPARVLLAG